ncbi:hypothetical protein KL918_000782 [Ogataea parapolymorpha]|uniref:Telomerase reverse transcriptase n=1 Tax=Ogataea parapolymorpha (strain ATCC 26012 / BCRC 20466 / JCM 22074 / NRRL Y-7560 / DL-1) TaxID=871575 RepID=W1Q9Z6_OGAPD|nr:telomerase reverse transcriptase [Ogataea parapolymorpha DL-1]ESW97173.1 telomerase reverse transcriptase [Ogataea parapolymorpha DL-1]KAG7869237.1 hypothetical protein KL918_000782 [Ogataea parapolymorpha]KAG7875711.1 hypothetical protein KL916_000382 [Ogataea parapolymorpha]
MRFDQYVDENKTSDDFKPLIHDLFETRWHGTGREIQIERVKDRKIPSTLVEPNYSHEELIDMLVGYLADNRFENALINGLVTGDDLEIANSYGFKGRNAVTNLLKSPEFRLVHTIIGTETFLDLLINYTARMGNVYLWGELNESNYKMQCRSSQLSIKNMLYSEIWSLPRLNPLPESASLIYDVFKTEHGRHPKLEFLLESMRIHHMNHQPDYPYILDSICPEPTNIKSNFDLAVGKECVIKFVTIILEKIMPKELFGSPHNKSVLFKKIAEVLNSHKKDSIYVCNVAKNFKITDVGWLVPERKMNKHEFIKAQNTWTQFIWWFFNSMLFKLVASFFHVTDISQSFELLYYRHDTWRRISKHFKDKYYGRFLQRRPQNLNSYFTYARNDDFIGSQKLLPKAHDLRFITMPFKGSRKNVFEYMDRHKNEVKIANLVLSHKRRKNCINSVSDLPYELLKYKNQIRGSVYALKFDIRQAYDTLPRTMILPLISELLKETPETFEFHIKRYFVLSAPTATGKRNRRKLSVLEGHESTFSDKVLSHANSPSVLKKSEIMKIVEQQLEHVALLSSSETFHRKRGVFQGFPLSGVFCEIVYDKLTEYLLSLGGGNVKIIRLADDFLILSTQMDIIAKYQDLIEKRIPQFNIMVNKQKSVVSEETIDFLGTTINLKTLSVTKNLDSYDLTPVRVSSFKALYSTLAIHLKQALASDFFNADINDEDTLKQNIQILIQSLSTRFKKSKKSVARNDKMETTRFDQFLLLTEKLILTKVGTSYLTFIRSLLKTF